MDSKPYTCVLPTTLVCLLAACYIFVLPGCTIIRQENAGENSEPHSSVLPAVVANVMGAVDGQFDDRSTRSARDAVDSSTASAEQTASSVPTLTIPLTDGPPVTVPLEGVDPGEALQRAGGIVSSGHLPELKDENATGEKPEGETPKEETKDEQNQ